MMRPALTAILPALVVLTAAPRAAAQATSPCRGRECVERKWAALHQHAVEQLKREETTRGDNIPGNLQAAVQEREAATRQASIAAAVDAVEPDDSTAAATVRRLAGAIKTNPDGTEAGLVIAPFALAGSELLPGLELTFAALKDDLTRAGASYTWDGSPTLADVWKEPEACPLEPRIKKLERPRDFYLSSCTGVVAELPETVDESSGLPKADRDAYRERVSRARLACGLVDEGSGPPKVGTLPQAVALVRQAVETTSQIAARTEGVIPVHVALYALGLTPDASALDGWGPPLATACYSGEDIRGYFRRLYWDHRTWKVAAGASFDLFPRKYGFSPDGSELPNGDVKTGEARFDVSTSRAGTEFSFGGGFGRGRDKLGDDLKSYVPLSFSIAHAFSLLPKKQPLIKNGELNVVNGDPPPRLVLGLITAVQMATGKRATQETSFNSVKIQPHVDFLISETLSFRLGIPINAEIVVREAKAEEPATLTTPFVPAVMERRDLQWTIPVAIVAVLKL